MPIGKLVYRLPEESEEFEAAQKGSHYKWKIDDLYTEVFRPHIKYGSPLRQTGEDLSELESEIVQIIWDKVHKHFSEEE